MQSRDMPRPRPVSGAPCRRAGAFGPTLAAGAALLVFLGGMQPATAQVIVGDLQQVSMNFGSSAQDGVRAHQAQVRTRQARVRQARSRSALPRIANHVTMSSERASIPLQMRHAAPNSGPNLLSPSTAGVINHFIQGDLYTDSDNQTASSLSTTDLTLGSDYRYSTHLMFGLAASRMSTGDTVGNTMSAYLTLQPLDRIYLDMSLSYGEHGARHVPGLSAGSLAGASVGGTSRGFSVSLNHPRQVGEWFWSPYSRYDHIVTDVSATTAALGTTPLNYGFSALSLGSTVQTTWTTPFGALQPMVMVEVQKEVRTVTGLGATTSFTQGIVGLGFTTRVSRNMSAFAQSRYESDLGAILDRQMMLGMKVAF